MARAKRHYLPGHVWHLTHRCHKKEFLLKFSRDRRRWTEWLFQAKKRHHFKIRVNAIIVSLYLLMLRNLVEYRHFFVPLWQNSIKVDLQLKACVGIVQGNIYQDILKKSVLV